MSQRGLQTFTAGVCPSGKRGYDSRREARRVRKQFVRKTGHLSAYLCPDCHQWHIGNLPPTAIRESRSEALNRGGK